VTGVLTDQVRELAHRLPALTIDHLIGSGLRRVYDIDGLRNLCKTKIDMLGQGDLDAAYERLQAIPGNAKS
jgi:hypothetical protein